MRTSSAAVGSLKKGDQVVVDFEFKTSAEKWCRVKLASQKAHLGYVQWTRSERRGGCSTPWRGELACERDRNFESGGEQFALGASRATIDEWIR
jgi:hypothetical protein